MCQADRREECSRPGPTDVGALVSDELRGQEGRRDWSGVGKGKVQRRGLQQGQVHVLHSLPIFYKGVAFTPSCRPLGGCRQTGVMIQLGFYRAAGLRKTESRPGSRSPPPSSGGSCGFETRMPLEVKGHCHLTKQHLVGSLASFSPSHFHSEGRCSY